MKKSILAMLLAIATITSFATVRTVSNSPFGGAQYSTLLAAYNAANNGDTLHVEGTNVVYNIGNNGVGWAKSLTVIGIGFNANKQNPGKTFIAFAHTGSQSSQFSMFPGGSGSSFYGINFTGIVSTVGGLSNVLFANCTFPVYVFLQQSVSGITFRNSIFTQVNNLNIIVDAAPSVISGVSVSNCVFNGYINGNSNPNVSMNVDHCVFLGTTTPLSVLQNATISNNIFMNAFINTSNSNCNFLNNISRLAGTFPPAGGNIASNNIEATDPNLVNYTLNASYSATHNYNLQAGSAAIGTGTLLSDIGVHGGASMFFSEQGEVLINPIMREVSILSPTVTPSGTLNVKIIATKPKDN